MKRVVLGLGLAACVLVGGNTAFAGRFNGPGVDVTRAQAFASVWYTETFRAGERAVVTIRGDGYTDLDLFVYDENGNCVAMGTGPTCFESVAFTPLWTGRFRIEVRNLGSTWNQFTLTTN